MIDLRLMHMHALLIGMCVVIVTARSLDSNEKERPKFGLLQENDQKTTELDYPLLNSTNADCQCQDGHCEEENGTSVCKCKNGWGLVPDTPVTTQHCEKCDCRGDRNCIFTVTWSGKLVKNCLCEDSYEDIDGRCVGVCKESTCQHGGQCSEKDFDIKCYCGRLASGPRCENFLCKDGHYGGKKNGVAVCNCDPGYGLFDINVDKPHCQKCNCRLDFNCTFVPNKYWTYSKICLCPDGYDRQSKGCVGDCKKNPCQNGGKCVVKELDIVCHCNDFFTGDRCEKCLCENGYCENESCKCHSGFGLVPKTFTSAPYCKKCDCLDDSNCTYTWGGFGAFLNKTCLCPEGYEDIEGTCGDKCFFMDCKNGGVCQVENGTALCNCTDRYTGENCETDKCSTAKCTNGGTCYVENGNTYCNCTDRYTGENCEIDKCSSVKCKNGGTCDVENGNIFCNCTDRYTGDNCETDKCSLMDCMNGGICEFKNGNGFCNCSERFTGKNCETDKCSFLNCENEGICDVLNGTAFCLCTERYTGKNCETDICSFLHCYNGGICGVRNGNAFCNCTKGYAGRNCETEVTTLQVTETSTTQNWTYRISTTGFEGNHTMPSTVTHPGNLTVTIFENNTEPSSMDFTEELATTENSGPCSHQPCQNGGTCYVVGNNFLCFCKPPFAGRYCEAGSCTWNPCKNGGICKVENDLPKCFCKNPFTGEFCQTRTDPCMWNPCRNGGMCKPVNNHAMCFCKQSFIGEFCESRTGFYRVFAITGIVGLVLTVLAIVSFFICKSFRIWNMRKK